MRLEYEGVVVRGRVADAAAGIGWPQPGPEDVVVAVQAVALFEAIYRSQREGRPIRLAEEYLTDKRLTDSICDLLHP